MTSGPWLVLLGLAVGTVGTMVGAGGGFLLMPVLLLLRPPMSPQAATGASMAVVFANALSGTAAYARLGRIDYRNGTWFALAGIPGAVLGAWAVRIIPERIFHAVFGTVFLAVTPLLLLLETPAAPGDLPVRVSGWGILLSAGIGFLSSFLGIGGGILHVPAMVFLLRFPVRLATATSHFVLLVTAAVVTAIHLADGSLSGVLQPTLFLAAGVIPGGQLGARLSEEVPRRWILRTLAIGVGLVGLRILWLSART